MIDGLGLMDIVDILLVAIVMYQLYKLVNKSGPSSAIFKGILAFFLIWVVVSQVFQMRLMGSIFDKIVDAGLLVLIILFQDEIRRFLMNLGTKKAFRFFSGIFDRNKSELSDTMITPLVLACMNMAKSHTGALIVIEQEIGLDNFEETGEIINASVSTRLIENIFFKNSPLHDGAMIIASGKIEAAGCILPISQNPDIPKQYGLRHRAALGISQETDAKVIVISEETGRISFASEGKLQANVSPEKLQELLASSLKKKKSPAKN